jgi:complement component 1 Q subcomponent-binding protein
MRLAPGMIRRINPARWTAAAKTYRATRPYSCMVAEPFSRATTTTNTNTLVPLLSSSSSPSIIDCRRHFSSSEAQTNLMDILAREEQEEVDSGNMELPKELAELKSDLEANWRIVDDGSATTQLFLKEKKVQVSFHCQDTIEEEEADIGGYEEDEEEEDVEEVEDEETMAPVRFTVTVAKAGKTMVFYCLSEFGQLKITGMANTSSLTPDVVHAQQGVLEKNDYQGPEFIELAEDLQDAFGDYLEEECGVNSDVATFVAMYADYKEQKQYVQFLKDAQAIIS